MMLQLMKQVVLVVLVVVEPVMVDQMPVPHLETHKALKVGQVHHPHQHMVLEEAVVLEELVMQALDQVVVMVVLVFKFHLHLEILLQP
jgi:hypothetical protein